MARRGHGEGSIIYLRSDGRWAASISLEGGKRKTFYGKTRKEVQEQLKTALYDQQKGMLATGRNKRLSSFAIIGWKLIKQLFVSAPMNVMRNSCESISSRLLGITSCRN